MEFSEYQKQALTTAVYPREREVEYPLLGLTNEAGEAAGKLKKVWRGDKTIEDVTDPLLDELGDCLWYIAMVTYDLGYNLEYVAARNLGKLSDRADRGVIRGDGDKR